MDIWNYKKQQEFEHELINRRLSWLFSSQSILFAALAFVLEKKKGLGNDKIVFQFTIEILGLVISLLVLVAIWAGVRAKYINYEDEKRLGNAQYWGVRDHLTKRALTADKYIRVAFALAWIVLIVWAIIALFEKGEN